jgi:hypothetical protein
MYALGSFKVMVQKKIHAPRRQKYAGKGESVENLQPEERNLAQNQIHMHISQNQTVFLLPGLQKRYSQRTRRVPDEGYTFFCEYFCELLGKVPGI